jgi:hypothetical protein
MRTSVALTAIAVVVALVSATTITQANDLKKSGQKVSPTIVPNFNQPDLSARNATYTLTPEDLKLDCKKLSGHIQIRVRQIRAIRDEKPTSALSRGAQQAVAPFIAGSTHGIDPGGDNARNEAMVRAFNGQLAAKGCQTFDLAADLAQGATHTPRPLPKPNANKGSAQVKPGQTPTIPATTAPPKPN